MLYSNPRNTSLTLRRAADEYWALRGTQLVDLTPVTQAEREKHVLPDAYRAGGETIVHVANNFHVKLSDQGKVIVRAGAQSIARGSFENDDAAIIIEESPVNFTCYRCCDAAKLERFAGAIYGKIEWDSPAGGCIKTAAL